MDTAKLKTVWDQHLNENKMSYWGHLKFGLSGAACIIWCGTKLFIHAIIPCFNVKILRQTENYISNKRYIANWKAISNRERLEKREERN